MKERLDRVAITLGIFITIIILGITAIVINFIEWTDNNFWTLLGITLFVGICAYFIGGITAGQQSGYRGGKHGYYVGIITGIIVLTINTIANLIIYGMLGMIWFSVIGIFFISGVSALGGLLGVKLSKKDIKVNDKHLDFLTHCPKCNSEVTLRTVINGKDVGKRFYVCNNYPECKGRIRV